MRNKKLMENIEGGTVSEECLSDDLLLSYFEGTLPEKSTGMVQRHLNSCSICFQITVSLVKNSASPYADAEEREVEKLITLAPEVQVAKIISYVDEPPAQTRPRLSERIKAMVAKLTVATTNLHLCASPLPAPLQQGLAFVAALALSAGAFWGVRYHNTTYRIRQAENILKENCQIYMAATPRLSGGYASTGIQVLMGPEEGTTKESYLEEARTCIAAAMASGSKTTKAMLLLAQIAIIERDYARADSILHAIAPEPKQSAAALNDLGVLQFAQDDWHGAVRYFEAALHLDAKLKEARYNLALSKCQMGANQEAIQVLNAYIGIETDEGWKNAAQELKKKLQENKVE